MRVGDTVRRPVGPRSDFVHELLLFLERAGFDGAPRFLGLDERGREVLSFLPGEPLPGTANLTDGQIVSAAGLLRRYHDAAVPLAGDAETVVHGDPGPWNVLWLGDGASALVDFDEARPGRRSEDLGYFAWKGLRLVPDGPAPREQRRRLRLLARSYGVPVDDDLLASIVGAIDRLHGKGDREGWSATALTGIAAERAWVVEQLPALR